MAGLTGNDLIDMFCKDFPEWRLYQSELMIGYDWNNNRTRMYWGTHIVGSNSMITGGESEMFKTPDEAKKGDGI